MKFRVIFAAVCQDICETFQRIHDFQAAVGERIERLIIRVHHHAAGHAEPIPQIVAVGVQHDVMPPPKRQIRLLRVVEIARRKLRQLLPRRVIALIRERLAGAVQQRVKIVGFIVVIAFAVIQIFRRNRRSFRERIRAAEQNFRAQVAVVVFCLRKGRPERIVFNVRHVAAVRALRERRIEK